MDRHSTASSRHHPLDARHALGQALQQTVNALSIGAIYALIALGYTMVYGIIELINFAHGDIFMLGAFVVRRLPRRDHGPDRRASTTSRS